MSVPSNNPATILDNASTARLPFLTTLTLSHSGGPVFDPDQRGSRNTCDKVNDVSGGSLERRQIRNQVGPLGVVLQPAIGHGGARHHRARRLEVLIECRRIPCKMRVLVGWRIVETRHRTCLTANDTEQTGADHVLAWLHGMANRTVRIEHRLARGGICGIGG